MRFACLYTHQRHRYRCGQGIKRLSFDDTNVPRCQEQLGSGLQGELERRCDFIKVTHSYPSVQQRRTNSGHRPLFHHLPELSRSAALVESSCIQKTKKCLCWLFRIAGRSKRMITWAKLTTQGPKQKATNHQRPYRGWAASKKKTSKS